ncbi:ABC transporter permease [Trujillonella endophytica]|uniref:ABC transporter permease n=1 Tax=Trujillonella endophytica TaxID=673521 RepID=UPI00147BD922|nr:ABC transporter permease [Trujillella endophytica]
MARLLAGAQLNKFSGLLILAALIIVFGLLRPETFLTLANARSILATQAIVAVLAIGLLFPLAAGAFDLSAAQNLGFSAVLCGVLLTKQDLPVPLAILVTLVVGGVIGAFNGFLVAVIGIDSFIATLGTTSLLLAGSQILAEGAFIGPLDDSFLAITDQKVFTLPIIVLYVAVLALLAWYVIEHSPLGRRIYATGANPEAAHLSGVATKRLVFFSLVTSAVVASAAGVLLASTLGSVSESIGPEYLLPAFAAVFLGTTQLKPGRFNVGGTLIAILLLGTGVAGLQLLGAPIWVTALFNGIALIVAVGAVLMVKRVQERRAVRRAAQAARQVAASTPVASTTA